MNTNTTTSLSGTKPNLLLTFFMESKIAKVWSLIDLKWAYESAHKRTLEGTTVISRPIIFMSTGSIPRGPTGAIEFYIFDRSFSPLRHNSHALLLLTFAYLL